MRTAILLFAACVAASAQEFKLPANLNKLADKASEVVDLALDGPLLKMASRFLSKADPDEAKIKDLVSGLKGIYVKSFEFEEEGGYTPSDIEAIRAQLRGPGWSRMLGAASKKGHENAEIFTKLEGNRVGGFVLISAEPKELTIVHIEGNIDLDQLSELGGHFGIPDLEIPHGKKKPTAPKQ